uniref:Uncharacterized protein n=1 Tax=Romanomermis culicivorax TaxID=13658 RepID=A0A915I7R4_ROMCU
MATVVIIWVPGNTAERTSSRIIAGKATCESIRYTLSVESSGITLFNGTLWKAVMSILASRSISAA